MEDVAEDCGGEEVGLGPSGGVDGGSCRDETDDGLGGGVDDGNDGLRGGRRVGS